AFTIVLLTVLGGLLASTWMFVKERSERQRAELAEQKAKTEASRAEQVSRFLKETLAGAGPLVALGRDTTLLREILDRTADRIGRELSGHADLEAELRAIVGK